MIRNQRPGIAGRFALSQNSSEAVEEIIPVTIAHKDLIASNSATHHVVQRIRRICPTLSGQGQLLSHALQVSGNNIMYVSYLLMIR